MTSSSSSSGRRVAALASLALALSATGCGGASRTAIPDATGAAPPPTRLRVALYPPQNASGRPARVKELEQGLELALRARGVEVVAGDAVRRALAARRIRYTGGLDRESAAAVRDGLGVEAVFIPTVLLDDPAYPPRLAVDGRLVSAADPPAILWEDGVARGGADYPGWFSQGIVSSIGALQGQVLSDLAGSLSEWLDGKGAPRPGCDAIRPRIAYRSRKLDVAGLRTVAVLPFVNQTTRRNAGEAFELQVLRELVATGQFKVVEPGNVRERMLAGRIIVEGGASLDAARVMGEALGADVLLAGFVRDFQDPPAQSGPPQVELGVQAIDGRTGDVLWWSSSRSRGDDGVFFWGIGRVSTAAELACGVSRGIAGRMAGDRPAPAPSGPPSGARSAPADDSRAAGGVGTP